MHVGREDRHGMYLYTLLHREVDTALDKLRLRGRGIAEQSNPFPATLHPPQIETQGTGRAASLLGFPSTANCPVKPGKRSGCPLTIWDLGDLRTVAVWGLGRKWVHELD